MAQFEAEQWLSVTGMPAQFRTEWWLSFTGHLAQPSTEYSLDLTQESTRNYFGVTTNMITGQSYSNTQVIWQWAYSNGYTDIAFPCINIDTILENALL